MKASLEIIEEIKQLKSRYCRCIDTKDWVELEKTYTTDTRIDLGDEKALPEFQGAIVGIPAVIKSMSDALGDGCSIHICFLPEIELVSPDRARGIWGLEYRTRQPKGSPIPTLHGFAFSHDEYERHDGRWLIKSVRLQTMWNDAVPS